MGRFSVEVELSNNRDLILAEEGSIPESGIRRVAIPGVVDSGAARLVIPESAAQHLGLKDSGKTRVRYADGRTAQRRMVSGIHLSYGGRS